MAATVTGILLSGTLAARPAATAVSAGTLYSASDTSLVYQSSGTAWSTWATLGGGGSSVSFGSNSNAVSSANAAGASGSNSRADHVHRGVASVTAGGSNSLYGDVNLSAGTGMAITANGNTLLLTSSATGGGAAAADVVSVATGAGAIIIPGLSASPDIRVAGTNDDEFDVTDTTDPMTGWTTIGTPISHNINSVVKSHYYLKAEQSGSRSMSGIRKAVPSMPFTVTAKCSAVIAENQYITLGLFVAEAVPGKFDAVGVRNQNGGASLIPEILTWTMTTPTGTAALGENSNNRNMGPMWFRIIVASSTDITTQWSNNGILYQRIGVANRNPGFTIGMVGIAGFTENASLPCISTWDWIRFT